MDLLTHIKYPGEIFDCYFLLKFQTGSTYPQYFQYKDRLETYSNRLNNLEEAEILAANGFYFNKTIQSVRCFYCDSTNSGHVRFMNHQSVHYQNCVHVLYRKQQKNLLKGVELDQLYRKTETILKNLTEYCYGNQCTQSKIASSLGHSNAAIMYAHSKIYFQTIESNTIVDGRFIPTVIEIGLHEMEVATEFYQLFRRVTDLIHEFAPIFRKQLNMAMIISQICRICECRQGDILLQLCGHISVCNSCWRNTSTRRCPRCDEIIQDHIEMDRNALQPPLPQQNFHLNEIIRPIVSETFHLPRRNPQPNLSFDSNDGPGSNQRQNTNTSTMSTLLDNQKKNDEVSTLFEDRRLESLILENQLMIAVQLCHLCECREANTIILPCRHTCLCVLCCNAEKPPQNCPLCGETISEAIRVYRS